MTLEEPSASAFTTYVMPPAPTAMPYGECSAVLDPAMIRTGAASPLAPGANTTTAFESRQATNISPAASSAMLVGARSSVLVPAIVRSGRTSPEAPRAYTVTAFADRFVTKT